MNPPVEIRTDRRFGVTGQLQPNQKVHLLQLIQSEVWTDLLDVMEMVCIEMETQLINTDADQTDAVLANHRMAKAAWQIFTHMQNKVRTEAMSQAAKIPPKSVTPPMSAAEREIENILDPTRYADIMDDETRTTV